MRVDGSADIYSASDQALAWSPDEIRTFPPKNSLSIFNDRVLARF
ncbi:hypothetical protein GCM10011297_35280 [Bacterioplanes sanyensis]|nr:hypothetical protein GCM10011297_35280 [Bacterioplanes sanyensis]